MGKNIKSYATTQVHSPGKGREALWQKVQISRLQYGTARPYILFAFQITSKIFFPSQIPANYANSAQFAHTVRESREIRTFC